MLVDSDGWTALHPEHPYIFFLEFKFMVVIQASDCTTKLCYYCVGVYGRSSAQRSTFNLPYLST